MGGRELQTEKKHAADWWIFFCVCALCGIGVIMVFSASSYFAQFAPYNDSFYFVKRHLINLAVGFAGMLLLYKAPVGWLKKAAFPFLCIIAAALVAVLLSSFGSESGGALRWLEIGGIRLQPSEFCKPVLVVYIAKLLSELKEMEVRGIKSQNRTFVYCLVLLAVFCSLIIIEDLSSAAILGLSIFLMMCCSSLRWYHNLCTMLCGAGAVAVMIVAEPYRMKRMFDFFDASTDSGWQVMQAKMALGSGGLLGVGLGHGSAKLYWLPARHTDFIFGVTGEELGLLGCTLILCLFAVLLWRGFHTAAFSRNSFMSYTALGLTLLIAVQTLTNLLVVVGFAPVTGVTLPFISYGGSSLIVSLCMIGLILNISQYTGNRI